MGEGMEPQFEKLNANTIKDILIEEGSINPFKIVFIIGQLLEVLEYLNTMGYSYGTVSCQDIYVFYDCKIKLAYSAQLTYQIMGSSFRSDRYTAEQLEVKI